MGQLGVFALSVALALTLYGLGASLIGARRGNVVLVESARTSAYSLFALAVVANGIMLVAILRNDFALQYVAENSSRATPTFFKVLSLWSADEGSLLLWNLILAGYIATVAYRFRARRPETFAWAMAVLYGVSAFYLLLVLGPTRPFAALTTAPLDGRGPLPLLQNSPLMAIHPPFLYLGFIGFAVPFAFAIAALVTGSASDDWLRTTRRWTLAAWCCLTVGLVLGALWSYTVLGWGGFWAWDPVENIALLPWLVATAFLHSAIIQERRGMMKVWNVSLVVGTFALTTFGTFLTRGSILSSVHTFAQSLVGPLYLGFLVLVLAVGYGLIGLRAWRLRSAGRLDSILSREAAFLGNNWILLALAAVVLLGTVFPLVVEALTNHQVTVGRPYFQQSTAPAFLLLLLLMGIGPLLQWRRTSPARFRQRATVPAAAAALVLLVLAVAGLRSPGAGAAFGLAAFVITANAGELVRIVRGVARATGKGAIRSVPVAIARNRRLSGGLIAHIGFAVAAVAITAFSAFAVQSEVTLSKGQEISFAGYTLRYDGLTPISQPQRMVLVADVAVSRRGRGAGELTPSLNLYPAASEPIGTPSIHRGLASDLYASVIGFEDNGQRATLRFFHNDGVSGVWAGGALIALGGLIALWPRRSRSVRASLPVPVREEVAVG